MEGYLECVVPKDKRHKKWKRMYCKLDDISARLLYFKDQSQAELKGILHVTGCEVGIPVLGDTNCGVNIDDVPYCFTVTEGSQFTGHQIFLSTSDETSKKKWIKKLHSVSRHGAREAKFTQPGAADNEYSFQARVSELRVHPEGHAEYKVRCNCRVLSRHAAKRLSKEWDVWHRFNDFAELDTKLRKDLGFQMKEVHFLPRFREAFRGVLGKKLDAEFLEQRRAGLDSYMMQICRIRTAVDFFKHHHNVHLKAFVEFDSQSKQLDDSAFQPKEIARKSRKSKEKPRRSSKEESRDTTESRKHRKSKPKKVKPPPPPPNDIVRSPVSVSEPPKKVKPPPPPPNDIVVSVPQPPPEPVPRKKKTRSKPVPPKTKLPAPPQPGRNDLLSQIRLGTTLKKSTGSSVTATSNSLSGALNNAMLLKSSKFDQESESDDESDDWK